MDCTSTCCDSDPFRLRLFSEYINVATETYNKKDASKRAIVKLTEMIDRTQTAFDTEVEGIDINIDFLKRLENFMVAKNKVLSNTNCRYRCFCAGYNKFSIKKQESNAIM